MTVITVSYVTFLSPCFSTRFEIQNDNEGYIPRVRRIKPPGGDSDDEDDEIYVESDCPDRRKKWTKEKFLMALKNPEERAKALAANRGRRHRYKMQAANAEMKT